MQLSLRPYVTAGVAIAGASVIAIAPIQPTPPDVHIPNPVAEVARDVQLTANGTLPSIETQYDDLVLGVTELGLSLTVPLTAALIEAIAPDLIPNGSTAEAAATLLLLGLSGSAISGVGSIGTALQDVVDGFGCPSTGGLCEDLGTGYLALLVGAPSTIIDGFVNGGYGPDLSGLLEDASGEVFAGGLINPGGALPPPLEGTTILPGTFPTLQGLAEGLGFVGLLDNLGGLLGGLLDNLPVLGGFLGSSAQQMAAPTASIETASVTNTGTSNQNLVNVATNQGGPGGVVEGLTDKVNSRLLPDQAQTNIDNVIGKLPTGGPVGGPRLNVERVNPLDRGNAKNEKNAVSTDTDTDVKSSNSHKPGEGKVSVSDVASKVRGGGKDHKDDTGAGE